MLASNDNGNETSGQKLGSLVRAESEAHLQFSKLLSCNDDQDDVQKELCSPR